MKTKRRTGPASEAGKLKVSMNGVRIGMFSRANVLLPGEDPAEYEALVQGTFAELRPVGVLEIAETRHIISLVTRRDRAKVFERAAIAYAAQLNAAEAEAMKRPHDGPQPIIPPDDVIAGLSVMPREGGLDKLLRTEGTISKQLDKSLDRLRALQVARRERENAKAISADHPRIASYVAD